MHGFFYHGGAVIRTATVTLLLCMTAAAPVAAGSQAAVNRVTDQLDRNVTVPADPRRIVALAPSAAEIVFALGQGHRLVGATQYSDYPEQARKLPKVGSYVHLDLEKIVVLQPDLCIAIKDGNPKAVVQRLAEFNIPVYVVNPNDLKTVMDTILTLGALLHANNRASEVVEDMRQRIDAVVTAGDRTDRRPRVFFQIGIAPIVSVGKDSFIHDLIERAGGYNLARDALGYPRYSTEQVLALAPEVLIITSMARGKTFERVKKLWMQWPRIPAVQNQRVHVVDSNLFDRPTPRLVDALELLKQLIHPQYAEKES